ncbi:MAG: mechanosensitive ion channel [Gemmatimonadales bacterium]|jgi:small-conductance mechanosensitive channel|nr:MAG: mechanosensitive ion channel [Gemmatimonadales bacterium]
MLATEILDFTLLTLSGTPVTVGTVITAAVILVITWWVSRGLQRAIRRALRPRTVADSSITVITRLVHYAVIFVGIAVALDTIGFSLGALFAAGAVFAVGIGFAMQNLAQNFMSGVILLVERSIKPDDVLEVEGKVVRVVRIGIRTTIARTRDDEELIIPNSILVQGTVKNYTLQDSIFRLRALVGVVYKSDMHLVLETLKRVASEQPWRSGRRDPRVLMTNFGDSSVNFDVSVWMDDPWEAPIALSQLHQAIWWALKDADVIIAFPQLDVHLDRDVTEPIGRLTTRAA